MPQFKVKTKFVFEGTFTANADSREEAEEMVKNGCGLCLGGNIHTTHNDEDINWEFDVHPEMVIE